VAALSLQTDRTAPIRLAIRANNAAFSDIPEDAE
jgi:hypothetical protein